MVFIDHLVKTDHFAMMWGMAAGMILVGFFGHESQQADTL